MPLELIALKLLELAVELAPTIGMLLADAVHGKSGWWEERIGGILPAEAKIHAAKRALETEQAK